MARGVSWFLVAPLVVVGLVGCRFAYEEREPWRAEAEEQCVAQRLLQPSAYLEPGSAVNGNGVCGMTRPYSVAAVSGGFVALEPKATLACPLVVNVEAWFAESIQPAATAWFGSPVTEVKQISAYSCRTMNGQPGAAISEHAFGNALDISTFRLADGREVYVRDGWRGRPDEQGFLRAIHSSACERFSTVLAPGADAFHYDHIHVDLARRASGRTICKPDPITMRPPAPRMPEPVPMVRGPAPPSPWAQGAPAPTERNASPWAHNAPAARLQNASPWAQSAPRPIGPTVIEREPAMRAAGQPLVLGGQAPPTQNFGTQLPLAERVRQAIGSPPAGQAAPAPQPMPSNPQGLVPPGRIPNANLGPDPRPTGSIGSAIRKSDPKTKDEMSRRDPQANLLDPQPLADQDTAAEPASVFNLPRARAN
jgi:hypothetical protein